MTRRASAQPPNRGPQWETMAGAHDTAPAAVKGLSAKVPAARKGAAGGAPQREPGGATSASPLEGRT